MLPGLYQVCRAGIRVLLRLLTRWQVNGEENVPERGPLLILSNHLNLSDPMIIGASLSRSAAFMAKEQLFRSPLFRLLISGVGAFPVRRGRIDRRSFRHAIQVLESGQALVMFPEGRRSLSGRLERGHLGAARIASGNGVLILPVGISGSEKIRGIGWLWRRPAITVNIGPPFPPPTASSRLTKAELTEFTVTIMSRIAELLPPQYRGDYGGKGGSGLEG